MFHLFLSFDFHLNLAFLFITCNSIFYNLMDSFLFQRFCISDICNLLQCIFTFFFHISIRCIFYFYILSFASPFNQNRIHAIIVFNDSMNPVFCQVTMLENCDM